MAVSYTLDQYVNDLRAITAKETDPGENHRPSGTTGQEVRSIARVVSPRIS